MIAYPVAMLYARTDDYGWVKTRDVDTPDPPSVLHGPPVEVSIMAPHISVSIESADPHALAFVFTAKWGGHVETFAAWGTSDRVTAPQCPRSCWSALAASAAMSDDDHIARHIHRRSLFALLDDAHLPDDPHGIARVMLRCGSSIGDICDVTGCTQAAAYMRRSRMRKSGELPRPPNLTKTMRDLDRGQAVRELLNEIVWAHPECEMSVESLRSLRSRARKGRSNY